MPLAPLTAHRPEPRTQQPPCAQANAVFQAGNPREALAAYHLALTCVDESFMLQLEGFFLDQANLVKAPIHLNMAACQLALRDWATCVHNCGEVMELTPPSAVDLRCKALWRRAKARSALGQVGLRVGG